MTQFTYIAADKDNKILKGSVEASGREAIVSSLKKQNLRPLSVRQPSITEKGLNIKIGGPGKVKSAELVIFTRQLSAMVSAGVPLLRAIASLQERTEDKALKTVLADITKDVQGGATLAGALAKHPETFSDVYVNMVHAGEEAGILDEILKRLALQQEKNATIRKKVKSAMTYPIVLITITVGAFFGLMIFVIPQIGKVLTDLGGPGTKLPALTQVMLALSHFMISFWYILLPVLFGGVFAIVRYIKTPAGKAVMDRAMLKLPGIKGIIMKIAIARFARTFSSLMGAGVPVLQSLDVTAHAVGNTVYEKAILEAAENVKTGGNLSSVVEKNPIFPAIVSQMLAVGEETGQTDKVLVKVADFYEEEVDVAIDGVASIIEPVMIVFMGTMVGLIAASVMMPIASLATSIKN